jgi:YbbR domain-containing protein
MTRRKHETIGALGRAPARQSLSSLPLPPPPPEPPVERGAIRRWIHGALFDNLGLKFLSMVLAVTVFLLVNTDRDREASKQVGVLYSLPDDKVLVSDRLDEVHVTVKGPSRRFRRLDSIPPITLDLRKAPNGEVPITADMFHLPPGLQITSISPSMVRVAFDKRVEKEVKISPNVTGRPQHGYVVDDIKVTPATIKIRGAASVLAAILAMKTDELNVENATASLTDERLLALPVGVDLEGSQEVSVGVVIKAELVTRKLPGLVVAVRGDDATRWKVTPADVEVTVTGELLSIEKGPITPIVKVAPGDTKPHEVDVTIDGLSSTVGRKISPDRVMVAPVAPPPPRGN